MHDSTPDLVDLHDAEVRGVHGADMTMRELNRDICGVLAMAMDYEEMTQEKIANACDIAPSTLANKKSKKELPLLSFWTVAVIAKLAGYRISFIEEKK